jgi:hypothetical protein
MKKESYTYSFTTAKSAREVFELLQDIKQWWSGVYEETIKGKSRNLDDEFTFEAGGGVHYTKQKLAEAVPGKRLAWLVTESNLSFLKDPSEWKGTKISFDLSADGKNTKVLFTHEGLFPQNECYDACSVGWNQYLDNLKKALS